MDFALPFALCSLLHVERWFFEVYCARFFFAGGAFFPGPVNDTECGEGAGDHRQARQKKNVDPVSGNELCCLFRHRPTRSGELIAAIVNHDAGDRKVRRYLL